MKELYRAVEIFRGLPSAVTLCAVHLDEDNGVVGKAECKPIAVEDLADLFDKSVIFMTNTNKYLAVESDGARLVETEEEATRLKVQLNEQLTDSAIVTIGTIGENYLSCVADLFSSSCKGGSESYKFEFKKVEGGFKIESVTAKNEIGTGPSPFNTVKIIIAKTPMDTKYTWNFIPVLPSPLV